MKKIVIFIIFLILQVIALSGCGYTQHAELPNSNTKSFDDTKYGFVQYLKDRDGKVVYALNKNNDLYSYTTNKESSGNDKLVCNLLFSNTGGIKQYSLSDNQAVLTNKGDLYVMGNCMAGGIGNNLIKIMDNVSEFKVDKGIYDILALTNNSKLYGWGQNRLGQIGNGSSSNTDYANEVKQPYYIMDNVKSFYIGDDARTSYYLSAALTNNGELYVWGFDKKVSSKPDFEKSVERKIFTPEKRLDNVKSFEVRSDGLAASTGSGEVIVNEDKGMKKQYDDKYGDNKS
ncbi:hypothetical protein [Clostridium drakei]|uniref:Uncharacterized protein n=1 Tax=Clostridium drakei TaxID=332101 RepID=A0A2U8DVE1_9CLOT|nr:hypothetical protein [Clostridium drakei]AWI06747.1 hypothetical protein B9W14_20350 [Clostridium drakei]